MARFSFSAFRSVSLEEARETQDDGGGEDPAHDDEKHTPPLRSAVCYPGITHVEADNGKQEVEGIEEGLKGWWDGRLTGGCQVTPVDISEEDRAEGQEEDQPQRGQPRAVAVAHRRVEQPPPHPAGEVASRGPAALLGDEDAAGVLVMPGAAVDSSKLVVDLR